MTKVYDGALRSYAERHADSTVRSIATELLALRAAEPLRCKGCGKTIAEHDRLARCQVNQEPAAPGRWVPEELLRRLLRYAESIRLEDVPSNLPVFADIDALHELLYGVAPEDKP